MIDDEEARGAGGDDAARGPLQRQGVRRSGRRASAAPRRRDVAICRVEQLYPVPMRRAARDARRLSDRPRRSSGCRKSRRTWARGTSSGRTCSRTVGGRAGALHRAAAQREPGGRVGGAPRASAAGAGRGGVRAVEAPGAPRPRGARSRRARSRSPDDAAQSEGTIDDACKHRRSRGRRIDRRRARREVAEEGRRRVAVGDPLVELETDKIDLEVAAPQAGVLSRIDARRRRRREGRRGARRHRRSRRRDVRATAPPAAAPARQAADAAKAAAGRDRRDRAPRRPRATPRSRTKSIWRRSAAAATPAASCAATSSRRPAPAATAGAPRPPRRRASRARAAAGQARAARRGRSPPCRRASAPKSASACRSAARRSRGASSRRRAPRRCSRPSTRWT